jgi:hypothetical protein
MPSTIPDFCPLPLNFVFQTQSPKNKTPKSKNNPKKTAKNPTEKELPEDEEEAPDGTRLGGRGWNRPRGQRASFIASGCTEGDKGGFPAGQSLAFKIIG